MKSFILKAAFGMICTLHFGFSFANEELKNNAESCAKVKTWSEKYEEAVSSNLKIGVRDLDFRRTRFDSLYGCVYVISTPKGMVACDIPMILQPADKKRPVFAADLYGVRCLKN